MPFQTMPLQNKFIWDYYYAALLAFDITNGAITESFANLI